MARALFALLLATTLLSFAASPAFARGKPCPATHDMGYVAAETFVGVLSVPSLAVNGDGTPKRLVGVAVPAGTQALLGAGLELEMRCDNVFFSVGVRYGGAPGGDTAGAGLADDTNANASRSAVQTVTVEAGLGVQLFPAKDSKVTLSIDLGPEQLWANAMVSGAGIPPSAGSIESTDLSVRTQAAACMKLGASFARKTTAWGCLTLSALLYDRQPIPGGAFGLRFDL